MRRKGPPRVLGPYPERNRYRLVVIENGARKSRDDVRLPAVGCGLARPGPRMRRSGPRYRVFSAPFCCQPVGRSVSGAGPGSG